MDTPAPETQLLDSLLGALRTQAVLTACDLELPELLADGPRSAGELAESSGSDPVALRRLLFALAAWGVLEQREADTFGLTRTGACLHPAAAGGLREYVEFVGRDALPAAAHLTRVVRTGRGGSAFTSAAGRSFFEQLAADREMSGRFDAAMEVSVSGLQDGVLGWDWSGVSTVADIGGGTGQLLAELLYRQPQLTGTLTDLPRVLESAGEVLDAAGVADRCALWPGDFFTEAPAGRDVYLLVRVLHDWDDEGAARILRVVHAAAHPGSRLLIGDLVVPDSAAHPDAARDAAYDLYINLLLPGHERTAAHWRRLLADCGFRVDRIAPAGWRGALLECLREDG